METEIYYHYEFWKLKYVKIWDQKFISEDSLIKSLWRLEDEIVDRITWDYATEWEIKKATMKIWNIRSTQQEIEDKLKALNSIQYV